MSRFGVPAPRRDRMPNSELAHRNNVSITRLAWQIGLAAATVLGCEQKTAAPTAARSSDPFVPASATSVVETGAMGPARVEVTAAGFQPARLTLNRAGSLVFRRTTDNTCATAVVFPSLGIEKPLPLNIDVPVQLPPGSTGELSFQCGMGMYRGTVIAR